MLPLTNIHGKASNHHHCGALLLSFLLIYASFNYIHSSQSCALFLKCLHQNFQLLSEVKKKKKSVQRIPPPPPPTFFSGNKLYLGNNFRQHWGTSHEWIDYAFHSLSRWQLSILVIVHKSGNIIYGEFLDTHIYMYIYTQK